VGVGVNRYREVQRGGDRSDGKGETLTRERERDPANSLAKREREHRRRQSEGGLIRTGREVRERDGEWREH
jgi:hypothetical protein